VGTPGSAHDSLSEALTECAAAGLHGMLEVTGQPGGMIHLAGGAVTAIQTPGSPSAEVILLRSGLVTEAGWDDAFTAAAGAGVWIGSELVARDVVGAGELEALLRTSIADAMFVLASGQIEKCQVVPGVLDHVLPLVPGAEVGFLLAETSRRILLLASMHGLPAPSRERVAVVPGAFRPGTVLGHGQDEIVALADGRRTTRDIAFALGRGVYATTLRMAQLRDGGVLAAIPDRVIHPVSTAPGRPASGNPELPAGLPQRVKGSPTLPRRAAEPGGTRAQQGLHRLLWPRSGRSPDPGESG
jgi:hypothetical protein